MCEVVLNWMLRDYFKLYSVEEVAYICDNIYTYIQPPPADSPHKPNTYFIICEVKELRVLADRVSTKELFSKIKWCYSGYRPKSTEKMCISVCNEELYNIINNKQVTSLELINDCGGSRSEWYVPEYDLRFYYGPHQRYFISEKLCIRDYPKLIRIW